MRLRSTLIAAVAISLCGAGSLKLDAQPSVFPNWLLRHEANVVAIKKFHPEIIFVGDSITQELEFRSPSTGDINAVWRQYYMYRHAFNLGSVGDTTSNVLWRLERGELDDISPKLAVILIGTNDIGPQHQLSPEEAANGIKRIVALVIDKLPSTEILLVELLPRQVEDDKRKQVNELLRAVAWGARVHLVSVSCAFMSNGHIDGGLYREYGTPSPLLHPNEVGWDKMAHLFEPIITKILGAN